MTSSTASRSAGDRHPDKPVGLFLKISDMRIAEARTSAVRPLEGYTVGEVAARQNKHPVDTFLDTALSEDLGTFFTSDAPKTSEDALREVINSPFVLPGLSDGGAHMKFLTTGRYGTDFIGRLVRDMGLMDLEQAHWRLSGYSAMAAGFTDRGFLREGAPADVIVYDYDALRSLPPERIHDFPADDWRLAQKSEGYRLTIVNGQVTFGGRRVHRGDPRHAAAPRTDRVNGRTPWLPTIFCSRAAPSSTGSALRVTRATSRSPTAASPRSGTSPSRRRHAFSTRAT